jgi:hypothetical protein
MLTIPGHKGHANQNYVVSISLLLEWLPLRIQTTTNVGEDMGKRDFAGGNVISITTMENSMEALPKTKNETAI